MILTAIGRTPDKKYQPIKLLALLSILLLALVFTGCRNANEPDNGYADEYGNYDAATNYNTPNVEQDTEIKQFTGAIVIRDNWLYIDLVEILMHDEDGRILPFMSERALEGVVILTADEVIEQGLDLEQFHSWHYIRHNIGTEPLRFEITDETLFTFTDSALEFHEEDHEGNPRRQVHVAVADFIRYIEGSTWVVPLPPVLDPSNIGGDTLTRRPYFVTVQNGRVISVLEEVLFTQ